MHSFTEIISNLYNDYKKSTSTRIKLIDAYLVAIMFCGIIQFVYCAIVGTFPFNAFLGGFFSCVASLRMQASSEESGDKKAFGGYTFCMLLLFLVAINFMG